MNSHKNTFITRINKRVKKILYILFPSKRKSFLPNKSPKDVKLIKVCKLQFIENIILIALTLFAFYVITCIGETWFSISTDYTYPLVVYPTIFTIKDKLPSILNSLTTKICMYDDRLLVKVGWINEFTDNISFKNVENIELYRSFLGRIFNYGTITITTYGNHVILENISSPNHVSKLIQDKVDLVQNRTGRYSDSESKI